MMIQQDNIARLELIKKHTRKMTLHNDVNLERIVKALEEVNENDFEFICSEAEMVSKIETFHPMRDKLDQTVVFKKHFTVATDIFKHRSTNSGKYNSYEVDKQVLKSILNGSIYYISLGVGLLIGLNIGGFVGVFIDSRLTRK